MPDCRHPEVSESVCAVCGACVHDFVLNGACYACGATDIEVTVKSAATDLVPAGNLVRPKDAK